MQITFEPDVGIVMDEAEFDRFADEYYANLSSSIAVSGESPEFFAEYKVADVWELYRKRDFAPK